jgi:hypothetical protein
MHVCLTTNYETRHWGITHLRSAASPSRFRDRSTAIAFPASTHQHNLLVCCTASLGGSPSYLLPGASLVANSNRIHESYNMRVNQISSSLELFSADDGYIEGNRFKVMTKRARERALLLEHARDDQLGPD